MIKSCLVVYHEGWQKTVMPSLKKILDARKIAYSETVREKLTEQSYDDKELVIVIGGDGTFLRASHLNKDIPMIGINPHPGSKEGFYMQANQSDFPEKLEMVFEKKYSLIWLLRLSAKINNVLLRESVLNELYIGDIKPYNVFNYEISYHSKNEFQRGSGIIIGTPSGSSAWLKSSGGKVLGLEDKKFEFIARELYEGRLSKGYRMRNGILKKGELLEITCRSPGILVIDSISKEHELKISDKVTVFANDFPLPYLKV